MGHKVVDFVISCWSVEFFLSKINVGVHKLWLCRLHVFMLNVVMNSTPSMVFCSLECNIIILSYNNMVPWIQWILIDTYFGWFIYGWMGSIILFSTLFHSGTKCEMFANCDLFQYFHNEVVHIFQTLNYDVFSWRNPKMG
jgi:hypothetical protein